MTPELQAAAALTKARLSVTAAIVLISLLTGCGIVDRLSRAPQQDTVDAEAQFNANDPVAALIAYHGMLDQVEAAELRAAQRALADPGDDPLAQMRSAILLAHPRAPSDTARARRLLDAVNASDHIDAIKVQALARLLVAELGARIQLARDLERIGALRRASDTARLDLQKKLDALTEIERSLPARPSADAIPPEVTEENDRP